MDVEREPVVEKTLERGCDSPPTQRAGSGPADGGHEIARRGMSELVELTSQPLREAPGLHP